MSRFPYGKQCIVDQLQRDLDEIEKAWPMTGSYERIDPYVIPLLQGDAWFEFIVYHRESMLWFDKSYYDVVVAGTVASKLIRTGSVAFDLGCNSGSITLPMAMLAGPEGHVHAFDPYPWNAAATRASSHLNTSLQCDSSCGGPIKYPLKIYWSAPMTRALMLKVARKTLKKSRYDMLLNTCT